MGLAQDLTGSKGLGTGSGAPAFGINTQGEFCSPVATSCDILGLVLNVQPRAVGARAQLGFLAAEPVD